MRVSLQSLRFTISAGAALLVVGALVGCGGRPVTANAFSGSLSSTGGGTGTAQVYVAGSYTVATPTGVLTLPGYWLNGTWTDLALPSGMSEGQAEVITVAGSSVYVGGSVDTGNAVPIPGYWANGVWVGLVIPGGTAEAAVTTLSISNGDVYAGAAAPATYASLPAATTPAYGYWFDGAWTTVAAPTSGQAAFGNLVASDGDVLVAGAITQYLNGIPASVAYGYWVDGTWLAVAATGTWAGTAPLAVAGSTAYLATGLAGYYANGTWVDLSALIGSNGVISTMLVAGSDLYAFGTSNGSSGYVLNGAWTALPAGAAANGPYAVAEGSVYVCGTPPAGTVSQPGYWYGSNWVALPLPPGAASTSTLTVASIAAE